MSEDRVVQIVRQRSTEEGEQRLVRVVYTWPCFNCGTPTKVDGAAYRLLRSNKITGIACGSCLMPPSGGMLMHTEAA